MASLELLGEEAGLPQPKWEDQNVWGKGSSISTKINSFIFIMFRL
jgi:hypothetical protein